MGVNSSMQSAALSARPYRGNGVAQTIAKLRLVYSTRTKPNPTCVLIGVACSQRANWPSTNRHSFATANRVVILDRVGLPDLVQSAGRSKSAVKLHLDRLSRFCKTRGRDRHRDAPRNGQDMRRNSPHQVLCVDGDARKNVSPTRCLAYTSYRPTCIRRACII